MIDAAEVIVIDYARNPVTKKFWEQGMHEAMRDTVLKLLSVRGPVGDDERLRIASMRRDEIRRYREELFMELEERVRAKGSSP